PSSSLLLSTTLFRPRNAAAPIVSEFGDGAQIGDRATEEALVGQHGESRAAAADVLAGEMERIGIRHDFALRRRGALELGDHGDAGRVGQRLGQRDWLRPGIDERDEGILRLGRHALAQLVFGVDQDAVKIGAAGVERFHAYALTVSRLVSAFVSSASSRTLLAAAPLSIDSAAMRMPSSIELAASAA